MNAMTAVFIGLTNLYPRKFPDGTVILTAPTGHIYTTETHGGQHVSRAGPAHR